MKLEIIPRHLLRRACRNQMTSGHSASLAGGTVFPASASKYYADFPVKIMGMYDKAANNMSCMSYAYYMKLKDPVPLKTVCPVSVHSATE